MRRFTAQKPTNSRLRLGIKVSGAVLLLVIILEVWAVNSLSTYGTKIKELKVAQSTIELQNQVLENDIARASSLSGIEPTVQALGFSPIKTVSYIKPEPIAALF